VITLKEQSFYFEDTRDGAKNKEPFAIHNADVAKIWAREYNAGEGPFKPVNIDESQFTINRHDLKLAGENTTERQIEAAAHNAKLTMSDENPYKAMEKKELQDELEAREITFKKSGPESTNEAYINLLLADDNK
jgi:RNA-splicing ligase RtcB